MNLSTMLGPSCPIVIALAGSNGAGKSTFYDSFLADAGLRFINADVLSASLEVPAYEAAELAASVCAALVTTTGIRSIVDRTYREVCPTASV